MLYANTTLFYQGLERGGFWYLQGVLESAPCRYKGMKEEISLYIIHMIIISSDISFFNYIFYTIIIILK